MKIDVTKRVKVDDSLFDIMEIQVGHFKAASMPTIFMETFEDEIDAFIELAEGTINPSVTEALLKRYGTIETILATLKNELTRISLKAEIAGAVMIDRLS